ncbi:MAG: polysaccharide pyruvyl transferase family protein [Firmicutes bacterium]|nr:polysaccharide pyruvyl transferase family protein [Bacillota bacterium]
MRYANFCDVGRTSVNIGDYLQFLAIAYLYEQMGIQERDIHYIGLRDIIDYDGEDIVLPINFSINNCIINGKIAISPRITPVFLAVLLPTLDSYLDIDRFLQDEHNHAYFLRYAPIGCRDEVSYHYFKRHGIPAYINGCLTAVFPKCKEPADGSVIFADAPKSVLPWIPTQILDSDVLFTTQQYVFHEDEIKDYKNLFRFVKSKYEFYQKKARLIITSRLHVALPCTAFGIPVVLVKDKVDTRFSFIEKYIPIYNREHYQNINWFPAVPDIEPIKKKLINFAIERIKAAEAAAVCANNGSLLTSLFEAREKRLNYEDPHVVTHKNAYRFEEYAEKYWKNKNGETIRYALWGASTNNADYWKNLIETKFPNAKLTAVFDRHRKEQLLGLPISSPDTLKDMDDICVIVCAVGATGDALALFQELGLDKSRYCIVADCFVTQDDIRR